MNIPDEAVEAAAEWLPHSDDCEARPERDCTCWKPRVNLMREALEAAAPILLSHEREQTRLAHLDAMVNRGTADKLQRTIDRVAELATNLGRKPEHQTTSRRIWQAILNNEGEK